MPDSLITLTAKPSRCSLEIGGTDISQSVTAIDVHMDVNHRAPVITVTLVPLAEVKSDGQAVVDEKTAEALKLLGWTPPPQSD